jgi:hypothetical protein
MTCGGKAPHIIYGCEWFTFLLWLSIVSAAQLLCKEVNLILPLLPRHPVIISCWSHLRLRYPGPQYVRFGAVFKTLQTWKSLLSTQNSYTCLIQNRKRCSVQWLAMRWATGNRWQGQGYVTTVFRPHLRSTDLFSAVFTPHLGLTGFLPSGYWGSEDTVRSWQFAFFTIRHWNE